MLSQNSKKRPSILEILKKPFLLKKAQAYLKELYSNKKLLDGGQIESIKAQAKALGFLL